MNNKNSKKSRECLVEIKYFQPEKQSDLGRFALDDPFCYPSRYVYANCWQRITDCGLVQVRENGERVWWDFPGGVCEKFLDRYRAEIVGKIESDRYLQRNRYELAQPITWEYVEKICNGGA